MFCRNIMIRVTIIVLVSAFFWTQVSPHQCRQVTVCDEDTVKGQKGEAGFSGKRGPKGTKGDIGETGSKGVQGESCSLGDFESDLRTKMKEISTLLIPPSCRTSPIYGKQTLRSGEEAFCDGGWTVIQRRFNGSVSFDRNWMTYKNGFGNLDGEFWFGLDKIHRLTRGRGCSIRFDLWSFDGDHAYAYYSDFYIESESDNYRLHIADYRGTAGDAMAGGRSMDGSMFSTKENDNDAESRNCAALFGPWWHRVCSHAQLNDKWSAAGASWQGIIWYEWKGAASPLKETVMKVRCD